MRDASEPDPELGRRARSTMSPVVASPRCARCRKGHQKCTLDASGTACARCMDLGNECELPQLLAGDAEADEHEAQDEAASEPTPARPNNNAPTRKRHKCDTCRRHHMTCNPADRVWPQKCQRCIYKGYECGPPRSKKEHDDAAALDPDGSLTGIVSGLPKRRRRRESKRKPQPQPHSEEHFQPIVSDVLYTAGAAARDADGDGDDGSSTDSSIPAVLPAKRRTPGAAPAAAGPPPPKRQATNPDPPAAFAFEAADDAGPHAAEGAQLAQLKGMVRTMEDEFREVLRGEQAKHEQELSALRTRYETDLREQRERYEARIDDLIKILGSTIASKV